MLELIKFLFNCGKLNEEDATIISYLCTKHKLFSDEDIKQMNKEIEDHNFNQLINQIKPNTHEGE